MRRLVLTLAAAGFLLAPPGATPAAAERLWCGLYCDSVYIGCRLTIGKISQTACMEWYQGCLDGCQAS